MNRHLAVFLLALTASTALAEPRVVVLPFDPVTDSLYQWKGGKESVLDYRPALQTMLVTELARHEEIRVVELADLARLLKKKDLNPERWNDPILAAELGAALNADYAIIGTYGEFSRELRVDARIAVVATKEVPPGHTVSATATLWEDLPSAATRVAAGIVPIVTASGRVKPSSKGMLFPEGDLADYDVGGRTPAASARLVVWTNAPAPVITAGDIRFARCDRIDLSRIPPAQQRTKSCRVAVLRAGDVALSVVHRGFLPYRETLTLAPGKAYRLEVILQEVELRVR
ncbi:hypothetical protein HZB60_05530 [candidate division KSB1 bacterium]|nr:hypothetical protein [candidate division KSB1 bacterium]